MHKHQSKTLGETSEHKSHGHSHKHSSHGHHNSGVAIKNKVADHTFPKQHHDRTNNKVK